MHVLSTSLILVLSTPGLAWIETRRRRILPPNKEVILDRLHQGELDKIEKFMPRDNAIDILKTDAQFWKCVGGFEGLLREHDNAVCCVQLCQSYVRDSNMDKQDVEFVSRRAFAIGFLILASIPEQAIRLFWRGMPHFCARWVVYLYWEAGTYTNSLSLEHGGGQLTL